MIYFNVIEVLLILTLMTINLWSFPRLSVQEKSILLERWSANFSFELINRILAIGISTLVIQNVSFLNNDSSTWFHFLFYILLLDFLFYWRHRIYHRWFWVFHSAHHSDPGYDFTLSLRIHPIETLIQISLFVFISLAMSINQWHIFLAVHIFSLQALVSHLDYELPSNKLTQFLRKIFVVSNSHRFHHDSNNPDTHFGFLFSFWDTLFGTDHVTKNNLIDSDIGFIKDLKKEIS